MMSPHSHRVPGFYSGIDGLVDPVPSRTASSWFGADNKTDSTSDITSMECPICLDTESEEQLFRLKDCGHTFHMECLKEWLQQQTTCPLCRAMLHAAIELRYRGHYSVPNKSTNPKAMHTTLHRLIDKVSGAGMFSKFSRSVRGGFNCDTSAVTFRTRDGLQDEQPQRNMHRLFRRDSTTEETFDLKLCNMREIYCRGRYCLLACILPAFGSARYRVYVFDAGSSGRAAAVFSKLREVCEPRPYIRGVRYE